MTVRTTGGTPDLAYVDTGGAGPPVVLLHSLGTDHRLWTDCAAALAPDHRVLVPDSRGHGRSGWADPLTVDGWVSDVDRVLDHAGLGAVTLVGLSMGGVQALGYAAAHPDRVTALVVADSFAELDPDTASAKTAGLADRTGDMAVLADFYVASTFTTDPPPAAAAVVRAAIASMDPVHYVAATRTCFGARLAGSLGRITAPTLVLWGQRDEKTPRALSERVAAGVPAARLAVVPAAGHLANLENPAEFLRLVREFLDEPGRR